MSQTQRRAIVDYSFSSTKPNPSPTSPPVRSTTLATEETSINSISKLPTATSVHHRGSSRGESPVKVEKRKEATVASSLAKGDFASRDRPPHSVPAIISQDTPTLDIPPPRGPPRSKEEQLPAPILSGSNEDSQEDDIRTRRVLPPGSENRPDDKSLPDTYSVRPDISPTKVYNLETVSGSSRRSPEPDDRLAGDEVKPPSRDYVERDKVIPSRRDDVSSSRRTEPESAYRDPEFEREQPRRYASSADRGISRYDDDDDDDRGSRSRYDKRDRGRDTDDRYSKGDTRVYPDDKPTSDERFKERVRSSYPEEVARRGDDDRYEDTYRDRVERPRYRDRDIDTRPETSEDRPPPRDDRYKDDDRYRSRIDEPRPREEDRYRSRVDDRYGTEDDKRYRSSEDEYRTRDDDRYRTRDDDRYRTRDEDRYRTRDEDRYRTRDEDRYRSRGDDRYVSRDDDTYKRDTEDRRIESSRYRDDKDVYRSKTDADEKYIDTSPSRRRDEDFKESLLRSSSVSLTADRKSSSSRSGYDAKNKDLISDRDFETRDRPRSHGRDDGNPSKLSRPLYDEERYKDKDDDRRPSRFDDDEKRISPTRIRDEVSYSRSPVLESRSKELVDDPRYIDRQRDRVKDDRYDIDDRIPGSRLRVSMTSSSRRAIDDRDEYRTKLPNEKAEDMNYRRNVTTDHRSYASEEDEEYKSKPSRRGYDDDDRYPRPSEETRRRYRDNERYIRRDAVDDDEYKRDRTRESYESDRTRTRDKYDDEDRIYDDRKYDRPVSRDDLLPVRKYDTYPEEDERIRRRDPVLSTMRKVDLDDRGERLRPSTSRDDYSESKPASRRRYEDDLPPLRNKDSKDDLLPSRNRDYRDDLPSSRNHDSRGDLPPSRSMEPRDDLPPPRIRDSRDDYPDDRRHSDTKRQPVRTQESTVHPRESSDVVIREKRFQVTESRPSNSRDSASDEIAEDRKYLNVGSESRSRDVPVRPLSAKDVLEAAMKQSDNADQNPRKVHYPVFDPRVSNLTLPEIIRPGERRGTTITAKRRRSY